MTVWLVTVTDSDCSGPIFQKIYETEDKAIEGLTDFCRDSWEEQHGTRLSRSKDNLKVIGRYFDFWTPEQGYEIEEIEVI